MYYGGHFLLGQIIEAINLPENIANHVCKDCEVKYHSPRYDVSTSHFLGFYKTVGYLVARGDDDDHFLGYGFCEQNSKVLYSYHKRRIPNSFAGTFFSRHCPPFKTGQLQMEFSKLYYFLPSITDRSESIKQLVNSVNLTSTDIPEKSFDIKYNIAFK